MRGDLNIRATVPGRSGRVIPDRIDGRRSCAADGCGTRLSAYNNRPTCWQHTQRTPITNYRMSARR